MITVELPCTMHMYRIRNLRISLFLHFQRLSLLRPCSFRSFLYFSHLPLFYPFILCLLLPLPYLCNYLLSSIIQIHRYVRPKGYFFSGICIFRPLSSSFSQIYFICLFFSFVKHMVFRVLMTYSVING